MDERSRKLQNFVTLLLFYVNGVKKLEVKLYNAGRNCLVLDKSYFMGKDWSHAEGERMLGTKKLKTLGSEPCLRLICSSLY